MQLNKRIMLLVVSDILSALLALIVAISIRFKRVPDETDFMDLGSVRIIGFIVILVFLSFLAQFYRNHRELITREILVKIGFSLGVSSIIFSLLAYTMLTGVYGREILVSALLIFGILQFLCHFCYRLIVKFNGFAKRVLILGVGPLAGQMGAIVPLTDENYVLSGYVNCAEEPAGVPPESIINANIGLYETVRREKADKIVVSLSERRGFFPFKEVMACKLNGVDVVDAPSFYEQVTGKLYLEGINPSWIIFSEGFKVSALKKLVKRAIDIISAITGILLTLPFLPLVILAIKLDSPGPVFYRQERVGEREKNFILYKLRTMVADAENSTGAVWAQQNDTRVTRLGAFLRKSRIDELPQFFNILSGDMSLVGPRPERPEFVEKLNQLIPYYSERHFVKPGVTGWAQVRYPYGASVEDAMEKLRYDLYYIKNLSILLDLMIILETIAVVLFRKGAR